MAVAMVGSRVADPAVWEAKTRRRDARRCGASNVVHALGPDRVTVVSIAHRDRVSPDEDCNAQHRKG